MGRPGEQFYPEGVRWDEPLPRGTLPDLLSAAAAEFGSRPAIEFRDRPISYSQLEALVESEMLELSKREREVLTGRFGLYHREPETLEALAERLSLTRERVRQIQQEALAKLKRHMQRRGIDRDSVF